MALVALLFVGIALSSPISLKLNYLDNSEYPNALCNDRTSAGYYYSLSTSKSSSNYWIVHLEGGHWCWDIQSCAQRNITDPNLMTNKYWKPTLTKSGLFDTNSTLNPILSDANKIYVPYCSSDGHMGYKYPSQQTGNWTFMGQEIIISVLSDINKKYKFGDNSNDILVFSGCSAGGRGAMVNLDYIPTILKDLKINIDKKNIIGILDSPLWIDIPPINNSIVPVAVQTQKVYKFANVSGRVNGCKCGEIYNDKNNDGWKCLFGEFKLPLLELPHVINAAQYDAWQLGWDEDNIQPWTYNNKQIEYADNPFRLNMRNVILNNITNNILSTSCFHHCVTEEMEYWNITIFNVKQSFSTVVKTFITNYNTHNIVNKWVGNCTNGIDCGLGCNPENTPY